MTTTRASIGFFEPDRITIWTDEDAVFMVDGNTSVSMHLSQAREIAAVIAAHDQAVAHDAEVGS